MTASRDAEMIEDDKSDSNLLLGRYQLFEQIGKGGMGTVFRAEDVVLQREVVVKKLDWQGSNEAIRRFHLEAKAAGKLKHANTVSVHDFGSTPDGDLYLVMEYVNGRGLDQIIRDNGKLAPDMVIELFLLILRGLDHAHKNGIIHRDVKPSNIMMMESDDSITPKLMDFGISRMKTEDQSITQTGVAIGSPYYASPEQVRGINVDERSDIYSVGCTMFEALTGAPPFDSDLSVTTSMMHISQSAPTLSEKGLRLPSNRLEKVVSKCLEKDPDLRFQSAVELSEALKAVREADYPAEDNSKLLRTCVESDLAKEETRPIGKGAETLVLRGLLACAVGAFLVLLYVLVESSFEHPKVPVKHVRDVALETSPSALLSDTADYGIYTGDVLYASKPEDLQRLTPNVKSLHLTNDRVITRECLDSLSHWNPDTLFLSNTSIGTDGIKIISEMDGLEGLHLDHAKNVSNADIRLLTKLGVSVLDLSDTAIDTTGLRYVSKMTGLQRLYLSDCRHVSDDGVKEISDLPCLKRLDLRNTEITDEGLAYLAQGKSGRELEALFLGSCRNLTANGLSRNIPKMKSLKLLDLSSTAVDNDVLAEILPMRTLRRLDLGNSKVTDSGIEFLSDSGTPLTVLSISHLAVDGRALLSLQRVHSLKILDASGLNLGDEGLPLILPLKLEGINVCENNLSVKGVCDFINSARNLEYAAVDSAIENEVCKYVRHSGATLHLYHDNDGRRSIVEVPVKIKDNMQFDSE